MFNLIKQCTPRLFSYCGRYINSTSWCPEEPFDPCCKISCVPNGMKIVTEENLSPLTCISLFANVGPRYETSDINGITHYIEHLVYKGFNSMKKLDLENTVRDMGARLTVKTLRDMQIFSIIIPSDKAQASIKILSQIICDLSFDENEMIEENYNMCVERHDADRDPKKVVFDYLHQIAFQGTPLAQPVIGPSKNVTSFNICNAKNYFFENYTSYRLLLALSGNVMHKEIVGPASSNFGQLKENKCIPDFGPRRFTGCQVVYRDDSMPLVHIAIAFEAPGFDSPDYLKMLVMSYLIGSWHKSQGRPMDQPLYAAQALGSLGLCESYKSFYKVYQDVGLWGVYLVSEKYRLDEMIISIQEAWMNMTFKSYAAELERAVNFAKLKIAKRYDGVVNSAFDIGTQMLYSGTRWSYQSYLNQLKFITVKSIREAGEKYLCDRLPAVVAMGPTEAMPPYVRIHSGMYWLRI